MDENVLELPSGRYEAISLRLFDATREHWSIWWIDARDPAIDAPVHGRLVDGVGTFLGNDVLDGVPILVRFVWSGITPNSARWAQACSDDGVTWETNWTMRFERAT